MVINHNMSAIYANRQLGITGLNLSKDMEKLSSGERINRAGDDASGLAVSETVSTAMKTVCKFKLKFLHWFPKLIALQARLSSTA